MANEIEQLCSRAQGGDETAASELITLFYEKVFSFFRRLSGNDEDAGDLTQKTFCKVWKSIGSYAGRSSFSTWLYSISYHVYGDWRRVKNYSAPQSDEWWKTCVAEGPSPFETVSEQDSANRLFSLVNLLENDAQEVIHLHYYQGMTLKETAEILGIATSTVKYRLREAIHLLQKKAAEPHGNNFTTTTQLKREVL